jgi:hypothetical protein
VIDIHRERKKERKRERLREREREGEEGGRGSGHPVREGETRTENEGMVGRGWRVESRALGCTMLLQFQEEPEWSFLPEL